MSSRNLCYMPLAYFAMGQAACIEIFILYFPRIVEKATAYIR